MVTEHACFQDLREVLGRARPLPRHDALFTSVDQSAGSTGVPHPVPSDFPLLLKMELQPIHTQVQGCSKGCHTWPRLCHTHGALFPSGPPNELWRDSSQGKQGPAMLKVERAKVGKYLWTARWGWCRKQSHMQTYQRGRRMESQKGGIPQGGPSAAGPHPTLQLPQVTLSPSALHSVKHGLLRLALSQ